MPSCHKLTRATQSAAMTLVALFITEDATKGRRTPDKPLEFLHEFRNLILEVCRVPPC